MKYVIYKSYLYISTVHTYLEQVLIAFLTIKIIYQKQINSFISSNRNNFSTHYYFEKIRIEKVELFIGIFSHIQIFENIFYCFFKKTYEVLYNS